MEELIGDDRRADAKCQVSKRNRLEGEPDKRCDAYRSEDQKKAPIPKSKRVPAVANETKDEREEDRNRNEGSEIGDRRRREVQPVLQHVAGWDVDERRRRVDEG